MSEVFPATTASRRELAGSRLPAGARTGAEERAALAEVQGLYGTFSFPELLLQKIWSRRDFDMSAARTADGRAVKVLYPGRWNRLGGPDFAGARLILGGEEVSGDVELHLHAKDWSAHAHASDPAYANVVLHVVLFPCAERFTRGANGREIAILCLLPFMHHGLEEYAADDAMEQLAGRPLHLAQEVLGATGAEELAATLAAHAERRWAEKVRFARARIERLGWEGACHHMALEVLGYRFNRAPMLSIASRYPLKEWETGRVDPERVFEEWRDQWSLHGVRPLNHPRLRLRQYARWCAERERWPERLRSGGDWRELSGRNGSDTPAVWRKTFGIKRRREAILEDVCAGTVGGNRGDNLVCDGFLPLVAAETGMDLWAAWAGWFPGDAPAAAVKVLRSLGVFEGRDKPAAQGLVQGLLGWMGAHEARLRGRDPTTGGRGT